ncbi:Uroporphyrinogen-III C-methyltransferase [Aquimixticola soesokkakensis]|uniref:uroporphyrinogen-III C-methyltransferase n=1 Tax=Aquimixticola soesokkakensis TaxID=1519096 RepID=A0A1Y5SJC8_9RHOB|nr:uroporphyrinogen-III C-methyltransferase [Aquimixticola soesokkakensis]SLN42018.1 Uroporphyrinogen-III C-methyltransferase [Aquimixticola soesokkakensis]
MTQIPNPPFEPSQVPPLHLPPLCDTDWPRFEAGWVWLVGAGPGDPGLLTLHGLHALTQADVIVFDALVNPALLDWAPRADKIAMGKRGGVAGSVKQADISEELVALARAGKRVLRLKGGDPFVFGRGGEEAQVLVQNNVPIRVIPGITAGIGGLAYAGIPVTHRDTNTALTFVTGHDARGALAPLDWTALSRGAPVLVVYMGARVAGDLAARLIRADRLASEPVAVVQNATLPDQRVLETTLGRLESDMQSSGIGSPAILCIGPAVLLRQVLDWQGMALGEAPRNLDPLRRP